jgi:pimeloyl-[acyl-carrier protein] methyl ester esterase
LRQTLFRHGDPHPEALRTGLQLLRDTDLRPRLAEIQQPVLVMQGSRDRLTPVQAGETLAAMLPEARFERIESAGHAPFLSHEPEFIERVKPFLYG